MGSVVGNSNSIEAYEISKHTAQCSVHVSKMDKYLKILGFTLMMVLVQAMHVFTTFCSQPRTLQYLGCKEVVSGLVN